MKHYRIADVVISINENEYKIEPHFKMEQFKSAKLDRDADFYFDIKVVDKLSIPLEPCNYYDDGRRFWLKGKTRVFANLYGEYACVYENSAGVYTIEINRTLMNFAHTDTQIFNLIGMERLMMEHNGIMLHSSLVNYNNRGIVFSAPSGTGKSTQAELWKRNTGAQIINGDKSVLKPVDGIWTAYGIPFSGSSEHCTTDKCPLCAIIYLKQAPENRLERIKGMKAIQKLYSESIVNVWDSTFVNKTIDLLTDLAEKVPMYIYECTKEPEAVEMLKRELFEEEI